MMATEFLGAVGWATVAPRARSCSIPREEWNVMGERVIMFIFAVDQWTAGRK